MEKRTGDGIAIALVAALVVFFAFQISEWIGAPAPPRSLQILFLVFASAMYGWVFA